VIGWQRCAAVAAALSVLGCAERPAHPNVVLVIIDDLGWRDTGVYGSEFYETPNIDRFAAEGARFTQFYAASPVCSPTRASIMTGKHPARLHITNWIGGEQNGQLLQAEYERQLPLDEFTLGEAFRSEGYATGYIGKWHLGDGEFLPGSQGFDTTIAVNGAGQPATYFFPYHRDRPSIWDVPDLEDGREGEYLTDRLTDEALKFIDGHRDGPFFLVLAHYAVHTPLESKEELAATYRVKAEQLAPIGGSAALGEGDGAFTKARQDHAVYAGMIASVDESLGRVMARLDTLAIGRNTIVVFVSDNGGLSTVQGNQAGGPTSNGPLRAGKGWLYEGGVRIPLLIRSPGRVAAGTVVEAPGVTMDLYPTLLALAGLGLHAEQHLDATDLTPVLRGEAPPSPPTLSWHFPHYHGSGNTPSGAVRQGSWKLVEWFETGRAELYDLDADVGESRDLASQMPGKAAVLARDLFDWRARVGAAMPTSNPERPAARNE
jgi:arylsulfatase A-like enzyme